MGDIYCKCGEPWDLDTIHEEIAADHDRSTWLTDGRYDEAKYAKLFAKYRAKFRKDGCEMFGTGHSNCNPSAGETFQAIDDIMGDDVDGAISMMEDAEQMGLF